MDWYEEQLYNVIPEYMSEFARKHNMRFKVISVTEIAMYNDVCCLILGADLRDGIIPSIAVNDNGKRVEYRINCMIYGSVDDSDRVGIERKPKGVSEVVKDDLIILSRNLDRRWSGLVKGDMGWLEDYKRSSSFYEYHCYMEERNKHLDEIIEWQQSLRTMKIRSFDPDNDFDVIRNWITDERTHMLWCAGRIPFPMSRTAFLDFLDDIASRNGDVPYVATWEEGRPAGFYTYSGNKDTKEGMLKFVVVDPEERGKGVAGEMLKRALNAVFEDGKIEAVHLNVFSANTGARRCYEKAGFVERNTTSGAFEYKGESWDRCNMIVKHKSL